MPSTSWINVTKLYEYVGPEEIRKRSVAAASGMAIESTENLLN